MVVIINKKRVYTFIVFLSVFLCLIGSLIYKPVMRLAYPDKFSELVNENANANGLDPYLVFAIIKAESGFNTDAVSHKGAKGLMQLMDVTAKECADKLGLISYTAEDAFKPEINIKLGCWYLAKLMKSHENNEKKAIASYNAGGGNVKDWLIQNGGSFEIEQIPFKETREYVKRVLDNYNMYRALYN